MLLELLHLNPEKRMWSNWDSAPAERPTDLHGSSPVATTFSVFPEFYLARSLTVAIVLHSMPGPIGPTMPYVLVDAVPSL